MILAQFDSLAVPTAVDSACARQDVVAGDGGVRSADGSIGTDAMANAWAAIATLPLRERVSLLRALAAEVFEAVSGPVVEWGDDPERAVNTATVDDELAGLQAERCALVDVLSDVVAVTRSLDVSGRVLADQHARVVSRFDVLDADQLERRLSSPGTALAGEFACDDFAPVLGLSPAAAARWAELGGVLRSRHPRLLELAGSGTARMRACEVVASELAHLEPDDVDLVEAEFLRGETIYGSEASIRKQLRRLLDHHGLARPREELDADRISLAFSEIPEQPTLTELNVVMPACDAWRLHAAIEARARAMSEEWSLTHGSEDVGYPIRRARVDALLDLALGNVRFAPEVRITVPVTATRRLAASTWHALSTHPPRSTPHQASTAGLGGRFGVCTGESTVAVADTAGDESFAVADLDVPRIGRVSGAALAEMGETLGAYVTVALADAASGVTAWTTSTTYRPGAGIRRHVEARDEHCRFPGCMRPAPMCDVDHIIPHAEGGLTGPANLQLLCRHHHRAKTHGAWAVAMTPDGTCVWQSPVGHWFRTDPADATAHRISAAEGLAIAERARLATAGRAA